MKFTCTKTNFNNGINIALKAVPGKTTMPILECVVIEAKGDRIDIDRLNEFNQKNEHITRVSRYQWDLMGNLISSIDPAGQKETYQYDKCGRLIEKVDENNNILLFCGKSKFNIPGIPHDEFPMLPKIEADKTIHISQFTLKEMIRQTIFSISDNESNKILTGELFEINGDEFKIASLDLVRVSIRKIHLKESYDPIKVVIPGKTLSEVSKVLNGGMDDEVSISFSKNHVLFEFDETVVVSRLIEGNFYNIDQMLKTNYETKVKINKNELYGCIDRATLLLREAEKKPVILHIKEDEIQMEMNTKIGSMDEEVTAEKEGKDLVIAFNPKYINDVLKVIDDEEVTLYLFNANAPCFIKNEEESYIYLILPVNMNQK